MSDKRKKTPFGWRVEQRIRVLKKINQHASWTLTQDHARALVTGDCHYCGAKQPDPLPGVIDRIDSGLGFTADNCVSCCSWCMQMKQQRPEQEFLAQCEKIITRCHDRLGIG